MKHETDEEFDLRKFVPSEEARKTFAKVFDKKTIKAVHWLATKGYFNVLEHVISTGKEAHVFLALDSTGSNKRAVKIYKVETSDFNKMQRYLAGDRRFGKVKKSKRSIVFAWAKKEFKNLSLMNEAGIKCPLPIACFENVLVMEFIEANGKAAPTLKDQPPKDLANAYWQAINFLARLLFKANLIYADFSEYNILNRNEELVLIDAGQAVLTTHPEAQLFFERDAQVIANFFSKHGMHKTVEEIKQDVKAMEGKI